LPRFMARTAPVTAQRNQAIAISPTNIFMPPDCGAMIFAGRGRIVEATP
jgi:hypothetical protein